MDEDTEIETVKPKKLTAKKEKELLTQKYADLVDAVEAFLALYKSRHKEIKYPGLKEVNDAMESLKS